MAAVPDPVLLNVDEVLMDHRMSLHQADLPARWAPPPPAVAVGADALIAQELGAMRRAQEEASADKKKTPTKRWGAEQVAKLKRLTWAGTEADLPPIYKTLAEGKGAAQDRILLQNAYVARCLEGGAITTTPPIVTPATARDVGALIFAGGGIEAYKRGASIFSAACGGTGELAEAQQDAAREWDLGANASTMTVLELQAAAEKLKMVLPTTLLSLILVLKAHSIGMDVLLGVDHAKAVAFRLYVQRLSNMETVLLEEHQREPHLPLLLMREVQVADTLWTLKQEQLDQHIPVPLYSRPLDDMEVAKYNPIRLPVELQAALRSPLPRPPMTTPGPSLAGTTPGRSGPTQPSAERQIMNLSPMPGLIMPVSRQNARRLVGD